MTAPSDNRRNLASWLPTMIGPLWIYDSEEVRLEPRQSWIFLGVQIVDNPTLKRTEFYVSAVPGGSPGDFQWHYLDGEVPTLRGTSKIRMLPAASPETAEAFHTGKPKHLETWADFYASDADPDALDSEPGFSRSQWIQGSTSNETETAILTVSLPAATHGDCTFVVHAEIVYSFAAGGGSLAAKATFRRNGGTLTRLGVSDLSLSGHTTGTAIGGHDIDKNGNDTVAVLFTGIAATNITTMTSAHVVVAKEPA